MKKLLLATAIMMMGLAPAHAAKKCADFSTQTQAQSHYKKLKASNTTGWKSLDRNKDGVACECLVKKTCSTGKKKKRISSTTTSEKTVSTKPKKASSSNETKKKLSTFTKKKTSKVAKTSKVTKNYKKPSKATSKKTSKK